MSFSTFGLSEEIIRAVTECGYTVPTPIQLQAIPAVLSGGDLLAGAQTGTGKTAGFTLPILHRLSDKRIKGPSSGRPPIRALILVPTRELAAQVEESVRDYGKYLKLSSMMMIGGVNINRQITRLKNRVDILVATPGRLLDHVQQKTLNLSHIEILVLDEADRMLDMGFIRDIKKILALLPKQRQNLLFSATFSDEIQLLAENLLNKPVMIEVTRRNAIADKVTHVVHPVDRDRKRDLLVHLIKQHRWSQVLVFTRTKHGANKLSEYLVAGGIPSLAIHGNKSQSARTQALMEFKTGRLQVLVATDIAARGIDISELPHVVNYELPHVAEDYVHRIGRTGRAGSEGDAVSLVCVDEYKLLTGIEKLIKRDLPSQIISGFEPDPHIKAEPIVNGRRGGSSVIPARNQPKSRTGAKPASKRPMGFARPAATRATAARRPGGRGR
jgi:ATP-dependent RNA helicase RhlE